MSKRGHIYNKETGYGIHSPNGPGMNYIHALRKASTEDDCIEVKPKDHIVGSFGIVTNDGIEIVYGWKVDGWRTDKERQSDIMPMSDYGKSLLDSMFAGWK